MPDTNYAVYRQNGTEFNLTIPDSYKLTFGPTVPGIPRDPYARSIRTAWCLRIYGPGKRLLAVYPDVTEFHSNDIQAEYVERNEQGVIIGRYNSALELDRSLVNRAGPAQVNRPLRAPRFRADILPDTGMEMIGGRSEGPNPI